MATREKAQYDADGEIVVGFTWIDEIDEEFRGFVELNGQEYTVKLNVVDGLVATAEVGKYRCVPGTGRGNHRCSCEDWFWKRKLTKHGCKHTRFLTEYLTSIQPKGE